MTVPPSSDDPRPVSPKLRPDARVFPRRFYTTVSTTPDGDTWQLLLDGRKAKTPGKRPMTAPAEAIAERLASEWAAQKIHIDPASMPLTTLACTAIDAVTLQADAVAAEIVKYAGTDLLCYRADGPEALVAAEAEAWDPLLDWAARELGAIFAVSNGLAHVTQPPGVATNIAAAVGVRHPLSLAALHVLTTLMGSAVLALAVDRRRLSIAQAWRAAHVDEDWQIAKWGVDSEAVTRRAVRHEEAAVAAFVLGVLSR
jgi:chaperone required for assembly of F1-ATPase